MGFLPSYHHQPSLLVGEVNNYTQHAATSGNFYSLEFYSRNSRKNVFHRPSIGLQAVANWQTGKLAKCPRNHRKDPPTSRFHRGGGWVYISVVVLPVRCERTVYAIFRTSSTIPYPRAWHPSELKYFCKKIKNYIGSVIHQMNQSVVFQCCLIFHSFCDGSGVVVFTVAWFALLFIIPVRSEIMSGLNISADAIPLRWLALISAFFWFLSSQI